MYCSSLLRQFHHNHFYAWEAIVPFNGFMKSWNHPYVINVSPAYKSPTLCGYNPYAVIRDHFVYVPSQWETMLQCNIVCHWLGAYTNWSLCYHCVLSLTIAPGGFTWLFQCWITGRHVNLILTHWPLGDLNEILEGHIHKLFPVLLLCP